MSIFPHSASATSCCEKAVVPCTDPHKQVENVDKSISLLNLINCQINDDIVQIDTVMDLDQFFPEPQETDIDAFFQTDLNDYEDLQGDTGCVLEVCIPDDKAGIPVNAYEGFSITNALLQMKKEDDDKHVVNKVVDSALLKPRRNTIDKAKLLKHCDVFHFHPPISSLRRCFSVDSRCGRTMSSCNANNNEFKGDCIVEKPDWSSEEDFKFMHKKYADMPTIISNKDEKYIEFVDLDNMLVNNIKEDKKVQAKSPSDYLLNLVCESPITDLDDLSLSDEMDKNSELLDIITHLLLYGSHF